MHSLEIRLVAKKMTSVNDELIVTRVLNETLNRLKIQGAVSETQIRRLEKLVETGGFNRDKEIVSILSDIPEVKQ